MLFIMMYAMHFKHEKGDRKKFRRQQRQLRVFESFKLGPF